VIGFDEPKEKVVKSENRELANAFWLALNHVEQWIGTQPGAVTVAGAFARKAKADFDRDKWEQDLQAALSKADDATRKRVLAAIGDPPDLAKLPRGFWDDVRAGYAAVIMPELEAAFLDAARAFIESEPSIGVNWDLVNRDASQWAASYTFELVKGITGTTRDALQEKVAAYFKAPTTIGALRESIGTLFDPVRAESIAITEITRAATSGEAAVVNLLELDSGIVMEAVFNTVEDERVCPLCSDLDGKVVESEDYAPKHPRCRCRTTFRIPK